MAAKLATIALTVALLTVTLHAHAHAQAGGGGDGAAEYVLLEPKLPAAAPGDAVNATAAAAAGSDLVCGSCKCCLKNTNPEVCLTTCCFRRTCAGGGSACSLSSSPVSCGCNGCDYPPPPVGTAK